MSQAGLFRLSAGCAVHGFTGPQDSRRVEVVAERRSAAPAVLRHGRPPAWPPPAAVGSIV